MNKLYNEEVKERFLSTYDNPQTQKTVRNVFLKSELVERVLDKDLFSFNLDEIGSVISNLNPLTIGVSKSYGRFIGQYTQYCIEQGLRENNINPIKAVPSEYFEQFVDKSRKIHYSYDELFAPDGIIESLENAQDQAFVSLVFHGILGQSFIELQLLHYNHINWNTNEIKVHDENGYNRTITVDNQVMRYLKNAYQQQVYRTIKPDGEFTEKELLKSDYVLQAVKSPRVKNGEPVSQASFYNRIKGIKAETMLDLLTPNSLKQSGMIYMAAELMKEKIERGEEHKITYSVWKQIGEKYNYATFENTNNDIYFNTTLMREFISIENIKNLYNLDVTM